MPNRATIFKYTPYCTNIVGGTFLVNTLITFHQFIFFSYEENKEWPKLLELTLEPPIHVLPF